MDAFLASPQRVAERLYIDLHRMFRCLDFGRLITPQPPRLTGTQMQILSLFNETDTIRPSDVSHRLGMSLQSLTNHLKRLEAAGIVCRSRNPQDRRVVDVRLTAKGRQGREQFQQAQVDWFVRIVGRLTPADRMQLLSSFAQGAMLLEKALEHDATMPDMAAQSAAAGEPAEIT